MGARVTLRQTFKGMLPFMAIQFGAMAVLWLAPGLVYVVPPPGGVPTLPGGSEP